MVFCVRKWGVRGWVLNTKGLRGVRWGGYTQFITTHSHYLQHFLPRNVPISIQIVHAKCPFKFLLQFPPGRHWQRAEKLPKIYSTVTIGIERSEHVFSELRCVTVWKEIPVDFLEFVDAEVTARTILQETFIPFLDFGVCECIKIHINHVTRVGATSVGCLDDPNPTNSDSHIFIRCRE